MTDHAVFIDGIWQPGSGQALEAVSPVTGEVNWSGPAATGGDVARAVATARAAQSEWGSRPVAEREAILQRFAEVAQDNRKTLARAITADTGKPHWEADAEAGSVIGKVHLSIEAYHERTPTIDVSDTSRLTHRGLGVVAVLGPFNFPAHLANGHMMPALMAGNTVVYKPSEHAPITARTHIDLLSEAGVPAGVINVAIGGADVGTKLVDSPIDAVAFTGSSRTGVALHKALAGRPEVVLALEMGGNNPLVFVDSSDLNAAVNVIIRSAFVTAGQRCTCARRLYVPDTAIGNELVDKLVQTTGQLSFGPPDSVPEPFMGPVISAQAARAVRSAASDLADSGATVLLSPGDARGETGFVGPGIVESTGVELPDHEVFGPLLSIIRYRSLDEAFEMAANTKYGLAAGLISEDTELFERFKSEVPAGITNLNGPTTGASGRLPFGGIGASGNHRPAGWYSADYCAYPVASVVNPTAIAAPIQGLNR